MTNLITVECGVCPLQSNCEWSEDNSLEAHRRGQCRSHGLLQGSGSHLFIHWLSISNVIKGTQTDDILSVGIYQAREMYEWQQKLKESEGRPATLHCAVF